MTDYRDFLEHKRVRAKQSGFKPVWMPDFLKPFQAYLVDWGIQKGKAAIYADCGLGKGPMALVFLMNVVKHINRRKGKTLLVAPLAVADQFVREGEKFGIEVFRTKQGELKSGINVTNYNRLHYYNPKDFDGMVCDESGILKDESSATKKQVCNFLEHIPYRLLCTATPSPNDYMELGSSSEALGVMSYGQMLGMFFTNDGDTTQQWTLKGHAKKRFWQWVASWARAIRRPSDYGFEDEGFALPALNVHRHVLPSDKGIGFLPKLAVTLNEQRAEKRNTIELRCNKINELLPKKGSVVIWCQLNAEGDYFEKHISGSIQVSGKDDDDAKEEKLNAFSTGQARILISKAQVAGYGLNWQHCHSIFYLPSWSAEQYYQAIRRCWRFGQEHEVDCHLISTQAERNVLNGMLRKEKQSDELYSGVTREMVNVLKKQGEEIFKEEMEVPLWLTM